MQRSLLVALCLAAMLLADVLAPAPLIAQGVPLRVEVVATTDKPIDDTDYTAFVYVFSDTATQPVNITTKIIASPYYQVYAAASLTPSGNCVKQIDLAVCLGTVSAKAPAEYAIVFRKIARPLCYYLFTYITAVTTEGIQYAAGDQTEAMRLDPNVVNCVRLPLIKQ